MRCCAEASARVSRTESICKVMEVTSFVCSQHSGLGRSSRPRAVPTSYNVGSTALTSPSIRRRTSAAEQEPWARSCAIPRSS